MGPLSYDRLQVVLTGVGPLTGQCHWQPQWAGHIRRHRRGDQCPNRTRSLAAGPVALEVPVGGPMGPSLRLPVAGGLSQDPPASSLWRHSHKGPGPPAGGPLAPLGAGVLSESLSSAPASAGPGLSECARAYSLEQLPVSALERAPLR